MTALVAALDMTTTCGGTAGSDIVEHSPLDGGDATVPRCYKVISVRPNDVCHLERWASHEIGRTQLVDSGASSGLMVDLIMRVETWV